VAEGLGDVALAEAGLADQQADNFGASVALSNDGSTLAVVGQREDSAATGIGGDQASNALTESGAVYLF